MSTKESLKIFVDAYLLNKEYQGTKTYIKELYKELSRRNSKYEIYLGCFHDPEMEKEFQEFENINFIHFKSNNRLVRMLSEIPKLIKKHQFDFAHFQYIIPFRRNRSTKYIVTIHDILFNDFKDQFSWSYRIKRNFLFKYSAKKSEFLCTVSNYSKERISSIYKIDPSKILVTPNGVSSKFFEQYDKKKEAESVANKFEFQDYLLYVSRIEPRKNQQKLIEIFSELNSDLSLVFVGEKTLKNSDFEKKLNELPLNIRERIHLLNNISDRDLLRIIRAAKLFLYPSLAEGFGIPPLEAAACKVPVICSKATAMQDFSFFAPFHLDFQQENIVKAIEEILSEEHKKRQENIHLKIKERYSWSKASSIIESIVKDG